MSLATFKALVEEVRSRVDIVDYIGRDLQLHRNGSTFKALSPFHAEKDPSFVVFPATQSWCDFSAKGRTTGDVFEYVGLREGVGFKDAVFKLAALAGVRRPDRDEKSFQREIALLEQRRRVEELLTAAADYYHRALPAEIRERWYRSHYGFSDETVDGLRLGWACGGLFQYFRDELEVDKDRALKTGLFVVGPGGAVHDFFRNRLVLPYWKRGQVVYFIGRATEATGDDPWEQAKYKKLLTHAPSHSYVSATVGNDYFYNEDSTRGAEEILITEGVTDCISALQAGVPCISPVTTRFRKEDLPRLLELTKSVKRIIICNDSEVNGAGEAGALETAAALWKAQRDVRLATIPRAEGQDKVDVNELVRDRGPEALKTILAQARSYPFYLLDRVPKDIPKQELDQKLEPVLAAVAGRSPLMTEAVFGEIKDRFGIGIRALKARTKELRTEQKAKASRAMRATETRPQIQVNGRQLRDIVNDSRRMVGQANSRRIEAATSGKLSDDRAPIFQRGNRLARLEVPTTGPPFLSQVTEPGVHGYLVREADWITIGEDGVHDVFPPKDVTKDVIAYPPPGIPMVDTVIMSPVFGREGNLISMPGIHVGDCIWMSPDPRLQLGAIPERPTQAEIDAARSLILDDLFVDFPFATDADLAHAVAALLLPLVRKMIDGCTPLHDVEAPDVGSGKGLLCNLISIVTTGEPCESRTLAQDEDEVRKAITAELLLARPIILFDNVREGWNLNSPALASVLTARVWKDRLLGKTLSVALPVQTMWLLTGNNVRLSKDLARRSVRVRLTPKQDRPWLRTDFKHKSITTWAMDNRSDLLRAALTLVRAWITRGATLGNANLGSFEQWAQVMDGILAVIGVKGFLGNLSELYETADTEGTAWRELVAAWWNAHGEKEVYVADLWKLCEAEDLMLQTRGDGTPRSQQSRLGKALQGARERIYGDLQVLILPQDRKKRLRYQLKQIAPDPEPGDPAEDTAPPIEQDDASAFVDPWT